MMSQQPRGPHAGGWSPRMPGHRSERADMSDINVDEIGPVDYLVVGFPAETANFSGEMATELKALIDSQHRPRARPGDGHEGRRRLGRGAQSCAMPTTARSASCARWSVISRSCWPRRTSRRSARRLSRAAPPRCWSGRTRGRRRSPLRCADRAASCWAAAGSRPKRSSPRSKPTARPQRKEHEDGTVQR